MTDAVPDYWCVVAIDYDLEHGWIVAQSEDCRICNLLINGDEVEENISHPFIGRDAGFGVDMPGLYRLYLKPWSHQDYFGEVDCGVDIIKAEKLVAFPELDV